MANTWAQAVQYAHDHPTHSGGSWSGWCEAYVNDGGDFLDQHPSFASARDHCLWARAAGKLITQAHLRSAGLTADDVPVGWIALWDFHPDGHACFVAENGRYLMASIHVTAPIHHAIGYISFADYDKLNGPPAGYTPWYRNAHLKGISTSLTSGGGGGTTTPPPPPPPPGDITVVLSSDDKTWIQSTVTSSIVNKVDDIVTAVWAHQMNSAVDGASHLVQTYLAWSQRDAAATIGAITSATPARILAKETSSAAIWALNPQQGSKRQVSPGQWTVLKSCGINFQTVTDGSLAAFTTVI